VRTIRKYPDMSDLPTEKLASEWVRREEAVNEDIRRGISTSTPAQALKHIEK